MEYSYLFYYIFDTSVIDTFIHFQQQCRLLRTFSNIRRKTLYPPCKQFNRYANKNGFQNRNFSVPRTTLLLQSKKIRLVGRKMNPETISNSKHENLLSEWLLIVPKSNFGVSKESFTCKVRKLAVELKSKFKNLNPEGLLKRHPQISYSKIQAICHRSWFSKIYEHLLFY